MDLFSPARAGPGAPPRRFAKDQIAQIRLTVHRAPEVMVKVTGGGRKSGAVAEHFAYISHQGEIDLETDDGLRVPKSGHKELLRDWHLELSAGQYRPLREGAGIRTRIKLVHNIVLSMPAPTPPDNVLAAAKTFAREKFALSHRYVMALHTHQKHPHVHLVVKAEGRNGTRLHIDKAMLREWREDFARAMREQGIAANATPRVLRGQSKRSEREARFRTRKRGSSQAHQARIKDIARELAKTGTVRDPTRAKLTKIRAAVIEGWMEVANTLRAQGEDRLAEDVRQFARTLPPVLTDRERVAVQFIDYLKTRRSDLMKEKGRGRDRTIELSR
jgi:hypothetical protein